MSWCATCGSEATISWQRWATAETAQAFHDAGHLPPHDGPCDPHEAAVTVYGCDEHQIDPPELMAQTHDATCTAPPTCDCSVSEVAP